MTKDYSQGKIYRIINDIDDYIYVGSTTEKLSRRMCRHRSDMKKPYNNGKIYQHIRKHGPEHFQIILIRNYPCTNKEELLREERKEIELINEQIKLNVHIPIKSKEERVEYLNNWYENNKQRCNEQKKMYRDNNKERLNQQKKEYYQNNKEQIKNKAKQYINNNKEIISERKKQYREKNKELIKQQKYTYNQHNRIMSELPFYRVPLNISF